MINRAAIPKSGLIFSGTVLLLAIGLVAIARDSLSPDDWLQKMSSAVRTLDYEGTIIRRQGDTVLPLKVVHKIVDGVIHERIVSQEGPGLEIIRIGDEVHCILPDKKSVLVEQWESSNTLFSALPDDAINPGTQYDVLVLSRNERIAGRSAVKLAIRPNDSYRFEHHYWLDKSTGFPLRTELIDLDGEVIDQVRFADIQLDGHIAANSLTPSVNLNNFAWYTDNSKRVRDAAESGWVSDELPAGFAASSSRVKVMPGSDDPVTHIVYNDGLARISVFISRISSDAIRENSQRGASRSFSTQIDGFQITAVGEVPTETLRLVATSMRRQ